MYKANVLEVVISSPSDVEEERNICEQVLYDWNNINSKSENIILQPVRWEKNVYSEVGKRPQGSINEQIIKDADILIAIFSSKFGSPTEKFESGTEEEIKEHIALNKPAMIFFSKTISSDIDDEEFSNLRSFKKWCRTNSIYCVYDSHQNFQDEVRKHISLFINKIKSSFEDAQIEIKEKTEIYSQTKQDAIDFLCALRDKPDNIKNIDTAELFLKSIGVFRTRNLSGFLQKKNLLIVDIKVQKIYISGTSVLQSLEKEEIGILLNEIKYGKYDGLF